MQNKLFISNKNGNLSISEYLNQLNDTNKLNTNKKTKPIKLTKNLKFKIPSKLYPHGFSTHPDDSVPEDLSTKFCLEHNGKLELNLTYYSEAIPDSIEIIEISEKVMLYNKKGNHYLLSKNGKYSLQDLASGLYYAYQSMEGKDDSVCIYEIVYDGRSISDECNH